MSLQCLAGSRAGCRRAWSNFSKRTMGVRRRCTAWLLGWSGGNGWAVGWQVEEHPHAGMLLCTRVSWFAGGRAACAEMWGPSIVAIESGPRSHLQPAPPERSARLAKSGRVFAVVDDSLRSYAAVFQASNATLRRVRPSATGSPVGGSVTIAHGQPSYAALPVGLGDDRGVGVWWELTDKRPPVRLRQDNPCPWDLRRITQLARL